jgi:hypothetical protein
MTKNKTKHDAVIEIQKLELSFNKKKKKFKQKIHKTFTLFYWTLTRSILLQKNFLTTPQKDFEFSHK